MTKLSSSLFVLTARIPIWRQMIDWPVANLLNAIRSKFQTPESYWLENCHIFKQVPFDILLFGSVGLSYGQWKEGIKKTALDNSWNNGPLCTQVSRYKINKLFVIGTKVLQSIQRRVFSTTMFFSRRWLWLSWQSGCFRHQRSVVWIQSLLNLDCTFVNFIRKIKIKNGPFL